MYKVLIVDDEYIILNGIANGIPWKNLGFEVVGKAQNGEDALDILKKEKPNLVVTDIKMPRMDGLQLCKIIQDKYPATKILVISGHDDFKFAKEAIEYKVHSYILKPIDEIAFIKTIEDIRDELNIIDNVKSKVVFDKIKEDIIEYAFIKILTRDQDKINEYRDELHRAGFEVDDKFFFIVALEVRCDNKTGETKNLSNKIIKLIKQYKNEIRHLVVFFEGIFYIIAYSDNRIFNKDQMSFCKYLKKHIQNSNIIFDRYDCVFNIGTSESKSDFEEIRFLVDSAYTALRYSYYAGNDKIILYDRSKMAFSGSDDLNDNHIIDKIIKFILDQEEQELILMLNQLSVQLRKLKILDRKTLCYKCLEIYVQIESQVISIYPSIEMSDRNEFFKEFLQCNTFNDLMIQFKHIMLDLKNRLKELNDKDDSNIIVMNIKKYLDDNYADEISLNQIADKFYFSPSHISKIFKEETKYTLTDYITKIRINAAKEILLNSNKKIQQIAKDVGYSDYRYFCTVFKKHNNFTPLQYRIRMLKSKD